ncbi:MAG: histidine kinase [Candidatus Syntrophoarchaeum caldarius]|uniref:histidine kinase n=1 Tax=Candidatus Syntropharchaeum caldarium TaxID=1838285 RepID=A0A1F2PB14_9EURY|nr:MAG: histidine kinase [Candidatus Syntrophoarchaeum caldarius]
MHRLSKWGIILAQFHPSMSDVKLKGSDFRDLLNDYERLKKLEEVKTNFLIVTAHELRTPLTIMKGYLELLKERVGEEDHIIRAIEDSMNGMISIVDDIVTIANMDLGMLELKIESVSMLDILDDLIDRLKEINDEWSDNLLISVEDQVLEADRRSIEKVLTNLITNALKYNAPDKRVEVEIDSDGRDHVLLSVKDWGEGVPDEVKEAIFQDFVQYVDSPLTRDYVGMGLGLSVARRLVDLHNGTIWVEDNPEGGSIFYVRLPKHHPANI